MHKDIRGVGGNQQTGIQRAQCGKTTGPPWLLGNGSNDYYEDCRDVEK